jgi:hypothetical protein
MSCYTLRVFLTTFRLITGFLALASIQDSTDNPFPQVGKEAGNVAVPDGSIEGSRSGFGSSQSKLPGMQGEDAYTL